MNDKQTLYIEKQNSDGEYYLRKHTIDWEELGKGFCKMLNNEEKTCMSFGMIPVEKFNCLLRLTTDKLKNINWYMQPDEIEKKLSGAIYRNATMVV